MESGTCCSRPVLALSNRCDPMVVVSCRGSGFFDLFQLFASFAQLTIRPLTSCEPHSCRCSQASSQRLDIEFEPTRLWTKQFLHSLQLSLKLAATCNRHRPSWHCQRAETLAAARHLLVRSLQNLTVSQMERGRDSCAHGSIRRAWVDQEGRISPCLRFARFRHGHTCCKHERRHVNHSFRVSS